MSSAERSHTNTSSSVSAFLSTLIPVLVVAGISIALFLILRRKFNRIYEPRTYLGNFDEWQRTPRTKPGLFAWIKDFYAIPDEYVLRQGIEGYLYLR